MTPSSFSPGQQLGRYRVVRLIAQGGMAEVYRADQSLTAGMDRPVALKVIRAEYSMSPDFREMFLDEARCACQLAHPNIVHIYEVGESDGLLYMAMELVPGETLATVNRTLREHQTRFSDEAIFAIGIACASALEVVHTLELEGRHANLVHRDVSPHNLLLSSKGSLKLIDFGIAKAATNRNLTSPGVTKGKAGYFSPEQAMGKSLDGRSDLFSLGITLYKLAAGHTPFDHHKNHADRNGALVRGQWEPLTQVMPGLPVKLTEVVAKATAVKPAERYADAAQMREALEQAAYESGFRISQSSLMGYVTNDGEISAVPTGSRAAISGSVSPKPTAAPQPAATGGDARPKTNITGSSGGNRKAPKSVEMPDRDRRRVTDRLAPRKTEVTPEPKRSRSRRPWLLLAAFALAAIAGVAATLVYLNESAPPVPPPAPREVKKAAAVVAPAVEMAKVEPPVQADEPDADVAPAAVEQPEPPRAGKPVRSTRSPSLRALPPNEPEVIPGGSGKLRINIQPDNVASHVVVGREDWGPAPVNKVVSSGRYTVSVRLPDGKKSPEWRGPVMPDVTTVLIYDIAEGRWQKR